MRQETNVSIRLEMVRALRHIVFQRFPGYPEAMRALGQAASDAVRGMSWCVYEQVRRFGKQPKRTYWIRFLFSNGI